MNQILDAISGAFGTFFADPTIQLMLRAVGFYIVFLWLATAYYAYRDTSHRTANPIAPYLAAALIILFTPILFVFAFVLYRILRPQETVAEAQERALAEEAMLVEVERQAHCANCGRAVQAEWIICPTCRNRLRRFCPNCSNLVELDWSLCPWCGKDFERPEQLPERVRAGPGRLPSPTIVAAGSVTTAQALAAAVAAPTTVASPVAPPTPVASPVAPPTPVASAVAPPPPVASAVAPPTPVASAVTDLAVAEPPPPPPKAPAPTARATVAQRRAPRLKPAAADGPGPGSPGARPK